MKSIKLRNALIISKRFFISVVALATVIMPILSVLDPTTTSASPSITEYPLPFPIVNGDGPGAIATAPDGSIWFAQGKPGTGSTYIYGTSEIVQRTTSGTYNQFQIPNISDYSEYGASIGGLAFGSDGALWFTDTNTDQIERFSTSGQFSAYLPPSTYNNYDDGDTSDITAGPDGALWFTMNQSGKIGRITTSGVISEYSLPAGTHPYHITSGPDGALWFTYYGGIGRITTSGAVAQFVLPTASGNPTYPTYITSGPDGALWFTEVNAANAIGRITTDGAITSYPLPATVSGPANIISGPDDTLWFSTGGTYDIGSITTSGMISNYSTRTSNPSVSGMTPSTDGTVWFTEQSANQIGHLLPQTTPTVPTNLTLTTSNPTNQYPGLSWDSVAGATSYNVYRNGDTTPIATNITATTYTDPTAPQGTDTYDVTAVNAGGESPASNTVSDLYDTVAPIITYTTSPPANGAGWNSSATTVTFSCSDPTSGVIITACSAPVTVSTDGVSQQVTGTATDSAGNSASVTAMVNLDTTAPTITPTVAQVSGLPASAAGWYNSPVTVSYACSDATSGIANCPTAQTESTDGQYTLSATATDNAGNSSTATTSVNLDQTPPSVSSVALPNGSTTVAMDQSTTLSAAISDSLSGVARAEYYVGSDPGQGNGTAMTYDSSTGMASAAFGPFSTPGTYTVYVRSQDNAGNWSAPASQTITVYPAAANLTIVPTAETNTVGGTASFTATATDPNNNPVAGITIRYSVSGSVTTSGSCMTDATGTCSFSYTGPQLPGADLADAYADNNTNGTLDQGEPSTNATAAWVLPQNALTSGDVQLNGKFTASNGDKMKIVAHARNVNGTVSGTCNLIDQTTNVAYSCTNANVLVENLTTSAATIFGDITLDGTATTYRLDVQDNSATNTPDTFSFVTQSGYSVSGNLDSNAKVTVR